MFEYRMIHRNGTTVWVKDIVHVVMGDHGPQKLQGIFVDITGSKQEHLISKAVGDLAAALLSETSLEEIAKLTLSRARELTASEHGYVSAIDQDSGDNISYTLTQMMGDPCIMRGDDQRIRFPVGKDGKYPGLWGCSLNEKEPMFTNDPSGHENAKGLPEGHIPLQNFLSAPALYGGELVGQIALANSATDYSEKDLDSVVRLADIYA
ncbi:MAG: GAF domain-containing protein, partial [Gammaproteobacteria bacterium]|nr:GAF domain-containing protein [Gammaproteobacteria bacterium]